MGRRWGLYFGAVGYLLVIWYNGFAFAPLTWDFGANLLYHACLTCVDNMGAGWEAIVLRRAPINGLVYAALGFLVGKAIQRYRRVPKGGAGDKT
jgi:hypothetical protein